MRLVSRLCHLANNLCCVATNARAIKKAIEDEHILYKENKTDGNS